MTPRRRSPFVNGYLKHLQAIMSTAMTANQLKYYGTVFEAAIFPPELLRCIYLDAKVHIEKPPQPLIR